MANILKRPMFRRGGPASYDVGITSGLRKGYKEGDLAEQLQGTSLDMGLQDYSNDTSVEENMEQDVSFKKTSEPTMQSYADVVQKRLMPTDKESVFDYLTSLGAAGGGDPLKLKTFGSVIGEATKNYQAINDPKVQAAKKAGADVYSSLLKGSLTKEKLYLYQQQAQDLAKVENIPYNEALKRVLAKELGAKDKSEDIIEKIAQGKVTSGITYPEARAEAEIEYKITRDPEFFKRFGSGRFKGSINSSKFTQDSSGNYILINPQQKGTLKVNDVFIDPNTKKLYYFDGKKLVPVTK